MTTFMRNAAAVAVSLFVAFGTVGCDDESGGGGGGVGTTTTTVGVTTTTMGVTTTTSGPTTTTTMGPARLCVVTIGVTNTVTLGALQFNTDYSGAGGDFVGSAGTVECTSPLSTAGAIVTFNDDEAASTLRTGVISLSGFAAPADVAICNFAPTGADPTAGSFAITVVDATAPDLSPATADVEVTDISCTGTTPTTTVGGPTTTTTTLPTGGNSFDVLFRVTDTVSIGALQFSVDYSGATGGFTGAADGVQCTASPAISGAIFTPNDDEAASTLRIGIISLGGINAPADLVMCGFDSTNGAPVAGDFVITLEDAAQPDLTPIVPAPTVVVQSITPK